MRPSPNRRMNTDANDLLVYTCDEASGATVNNTGSGAGGNLTLGGNAALGVRSGVFGGPKGALYSPGATTDVCAGASTAALEPNYPVTLSGWVYTTQSGYLIQRLYRETGGSSSPYESVMLTSAAGTNGLIIAAGFTTGSNGAGTRHPVLADLGDNVPYAVWAFIGAEYDGTNISIYVNGNRVKQSAVTGAIDWNTTNRGKWCLIGNNNQGGGNVAMAGYIDDVRFATVSRGADWHLTAYRMGMGLL